MARATALLLVSTMQQQLGMMRAHAAMGAPGGRRGACNRMHVAAASPPHAVCSEVASQSTHAHTAEQGQARSASSTAPFRCGSSKLAAANPPSDGLAARMTSTRTCMSRFWHDEKRFKGTGETSLAQRTLLALGGQRVGGAQKLDPSPGLMGWQVTKLCPGSGVGPASRGYARRLHLFGWDVNHPCILCL